MRRMSGTCFAVHLCHPQNVNAKGVTDCTSWFLTLVLGITTHAVESDHLLIRTINVFDAFHQNV